MDRALFYWINRWPDAWETFFVLLSEGNKLWGVRICLLAVLVAMATRGSRYRWAILSAVVAAGLANELTDLLKAGFQHNRPCVELPDVIVRTKLLTSYGTASAHAANMAAAATVFTYRLRQWGTPWIILAIAVGISRIYVGVHYPYQVLNGWICGILVGLAVVVGIERIEKGLNHRKEGSEPTDNPTP